MSVLLALVLLAVAVGMAVFWGQRIKSRWDEARRLGTSEHSAGGDPSEEVQDAWLAFGRAAALGLITMGLVIYVLGAMASPAAGEMGRLWDGVNLLLPVKEPSTGGNQMDALAPTILKLLVSGSSFLVIFALSWAFVGGLLPFKEGGRKSFFSLTIALLLSTTFAMWVGTSATASDALIANIASGFMGIMTTFLSILVGAIGVYLAWKQIQRHVKPK